MNAKFFKTQAAFRRWLDTNHAKKDELLVGYYKVASTKPSMIWSQSVDQALCYGWIDGIRHSIDEDSYCIRFTARRPNSNWSEVNIKKVATLKKKGLMRPAGLAAFAKRKDSKSRVYGYEKAPVELPPAFAKRLKANKKAWSFFSTQAPSYRRQSVHWIMSAQRAETRERRLARLIEVSAAGERVY